MKKDSYKNEHKIKTKFQNIQSKSANFAHVRIFIFLVSEINLVFMLFGNPPKKGAIFFFLMFYILNCDGFWKLKQTFSRYFNFMLSEINFIVVISIVEEHSKKLTQIIINLELSENKYNWRRQIQKQTSSETGTHVLWKCFTEEKRGRKCWRWSSAGKNSWFGICWVRSKTLTPTNFVKLSVGKIQVLAKLTLCKKGHSPSR